MRIGRFTTAAKDMVDSLFQAEAESQVQETTLSVKVRVTTASMLSVLSELFEQSRYSFTGEILDDFTTDLFLSLPEAKRLEIAKKADLLTTELLAKKGVTIESIGVAGNINGDQTWQTILSMDKFHKSGFSSLEEFVVNHHAEQEEQQEVGA